MKKTLSFIFLSLVAFCAYAQNLYIGSFYVTTTDEESQYGDGNNKWQNRRLTIIDMFNFEQPDVLGLQSFTDAQLNALTLRMTSYAAAGDILYNKAIELVSNGVVEEMPSGSTCTWAKFQKDEKVFFVFNVCFSTDATIANSSASRVLAAVSEINTENLPSFIIGNLGGSESTAAYTTLTASYSDSFKKASVVSAEYGTKNNFDLAANHGASRYDFVFASKTVTVNCYGQLQYGYFTKESDGSYKRRLPSTHFPVMARVTVP